MTARKDGRIDLWCNGSTAEFGSANPGSNPGRSAKPNKQFYKYEHIQKQERRADEGFAGGPENLAFGIIGQSDAGAGGEVQKGLRAVAASGKENAVTKKHRINFAFSK